MVANIGVEHFSSKHTKVFDSNMLKFPSTCDCDFQNNSLSDPLLSPSIERSTQRKFYIKTGVTNPKNIGLHVNTNLHLKPKKKREIKDYISAILLCLFIGQVVLTYTQSLKLVAELEVTRRHVEMLGESLDSISVLFERLEERVKELENAFQEKKLSEDIGHSVNKREAEPVATCTNCSNTREARSVSRGKHSHCKNRNGCRCRCYRTSGPYSVHLKGALPEISVRDGGIIAPWYIDKTSSGVFFLADGVIGEGRGILEILEEGLYFIYAQMYYLTSSSLNSYAINLQLGEGKRREDMVIAVCSAEAATNKLSELSCFTAVVRYLQRGDRIYVTQRERNRRIIFRDNKSFLGLTLLNSPHVFNH